MAGEFPAQMASNAENVSIWWRHHAMTYLPVIISDYFMQITFNDNKDLKDCRNDHRDLRLASYDIDGAPKRMRHYAVQGPHLLI